MKRAMMVLALAVLGACAPVAKNAVFSAAPDTVSQGQWVYVDTGDDDTRGVYHCIAGGGRVVCSRAELRP